MFIAKDLPERKAIMLEKSDAILVSPGGIGILDEVTEIMEHKKHNHHSKPIIFMNTENFYEGFKLLLQKIYGEGLLTHTIWEMVYFADTPRAAMNYIINNK